MERVVVCVATHQLAPSNMNSIFKRPFLCEWSHSAGPREVSNPILLDEKPTVVAVGSVGVAARARSEFWEKCYGTDVLQELKHQIG